MGPGWLWLLEGINFVLRQATKTTSSPKTTHAKQQMTPSPWSASCYNWHFQHRCSLRNTIRDSWDEMALFTPALASCTTGPHLCQQHPSSYLRRPNDQRSQSLSCQTCPETCQRRIHHLNVQIPRASSPGCPPAIEPRRWHDGGGVVHQECWHPISSSIIVS